MPDVDVNDNPDEGTETQLSAKELALENKHLQRQLDELREDRKFWFEKANTKSEAPPPQPIPKQERNEVDDVDLAEILFRDGESKIPFSELAKVFKKAGFVTEKEVEARISQQVDEMSSWGQLQQRFPEMANPNSDFAKEAQKQLVLIQGDPKLSKLGQFEQFKYAALETEIALLRAGKKSESEEERQSRIKLQSGFSGTSSTPGDQQPAGLSDGERYFAQVFGLDEKKVMQSKEKREKEGGVYKFAERKRA